MKPLLVGVEFPLSVCDQSFFVGIVVLQHRDVFVFRSSTHCRASVAAFRAWELLPQRASGLQW